MWGVEPIAFPFPLRSIVSFRGAHLDWTTILQAYSLNHPHTHRHTYLRGAWQVACHQRRTIEAGAMMSVRLYGVYMEVTTCCPAIRPARLSFRSHSEPESERSYVTVMCYFCMCLFFLFQHNYLACVYSTMSGLISMWTTGSLPHMENSRSEQESRAG